MNGRYFHPANVRKNKEDGVFEELIRSKVQGTRYKAQGRSNIKENKKKEEEKRQKQLMLMIHRVGDEKDFDTVYDLYMDEKANPYLTHDPMSRENSDQYLNSISITNTLRG
jgi:hypothetical protein